MATRRTGLTLQEVRHLSAESESLVVQLTEQAAIFESLSRTDSLTGIPNRRAFDALRQAEEHRAVADGQTVVDGVPCGVHQSRLLCRVVAFEETRFGFDWGLADTSATASGRSTLSPPVQ